jgi:DNA-binding beta-propeller fold protein YncE
MKKLFLSILLLCSLSTFSQKLSFDAKAIIAISDADMAASAYIDGKLLKEKGTKDVFSTIKLPLKQYSDELNNIIVSNSAMNWSKGMVISPTHNLAYIAETRGMTPDNVNEVADISTELPTGGYISVVDIKDINNPKLLYKFPTGKNPIAVDISPTGEYLALCTEEYGKELQVLELDESGKPIRIINKPKEFPSGRVTDITWHPNGDFLGFTMEDSKEIGLIKVTRDGPTTKIIRLDLLGHMLKVGNLPGAGQFTPNGKYYLVPDTKSILGKSQESDLTGNLFVIKFNLEGTGDHFLITKAKLGENTSGFTISPDGELVIATNVKKSFYPWNNSSFSQKSSLSLLKLTSDGSLNNIGEYEFDGIMPENVVFDSTGKNIAVTIFDYYNFGKHFGGIEFWQVKNGDKPSLQKQEFKLFMPRGCHTIHVIK